jgi:di/tricarboxylate transporter
LTLPQALAFAILAAMMLLFVWGRIRYDLVAILALLASIAVGTVPAKKAFTGFSDDIVIIVASALVVSAAVQRSGVIEMVLGRVSQRVTRVRWQLMVLVTSVTFLSALVKNIGALAMLMPAALKMAKKSKASPSAFLMPMSFGSLLGGLITLIGTSPNIIVSRVREELTGQPFGMFDYAPVGLGLAITGIIFLRFGYRLLPRDRRAAATMGEALDIKDYTTEAAVAEGAPSEGMTVAEFMAANDDEVEVIGVLRGSSRYPLPLAGTILHENDILLLKGEPDALERAIARGGLDLAGQDRAAVTDTPSGDVGVIEAVVTLDSILVGQAAARIGLHERHGVNLLAIARGGTRRVEGLGDTRIEAGDVIVLQGPLDILPGQLRELGCLPLAERQVRLGGARRGLLPVAILAAAMILTALGIVPVAVAFFGAATLTMLSGALPVRDVYKALDAPILIMLGA